MISSLLGINLKQLKETVKIVIISEIQSCESFSQGQIFKLFNLIVMKSRDMTVLHICKEMTAKFLSSENSTIMSSHANQFP